MKSTRTTLFQRVVCLGNQWVVKPKGEKSSRKLWTLLSDAGEKYTYNKNIKGNYPEKKASVLPGDKEPYFGI